MARQPEVFVRPLDAEEAQRLVQIARRTKDRVRLRRAGIVFASFQGRPASEVAQMYAASAQYVREVIHAFNEQGFAALDPKWSGGRPRTVGPAVRERVCRIAKTPPAELARPFTAWSLTKLADYLVEVCSIRLSTETIRQILRTAGISWQATKTWKASRDPDFAAKKDRILDLYDHPPRDGRVICVDEFGPLNLLPRPGKGWFPAGRPKRLRATYNRTGGVRHMFAALDLASGQMFYRFRDRKRWPQFLDFLKQLRRRYVRGRLYLICDNYGSHGKAEVKAWCAANDITLVFTPSNTSWLNWIEAEFQELRSFTLNGSDYPSHTAQEHAIAGYIRWKNKRARPKQNFAIGSKIRRPDYLPNVA
jgi:transposase